MTDRIPDFLEHMLDACSNAGVGFLFEEGGCWGMALALHETLSAQGYPVELVYLEHCVHAAVEIGGNRYDYTGRLHIAAAAEDQSFSSPEAFLEFAVRSSGFEEHEILWDKSSALEIIAEAQILALQPPQMPL